jgi:hypothetical protein
LVRPSSLPTQLRVSYEAITVDAVAGARGRPDIIAWRGESLAEAVFVEYKGPSDKIRSGQEAWLRAALRAGMSRDQFSIAKWPG